MDWRFWTRRHHSQADTCASIEPLLSLYSDGMASPEETHRVESHLSACVDCQRALRWMEATHLVISKRPAVEPPANLRLRIAQAIAEAEQSQARPRPALRPLVLRPASLALAVAASFAVVGALISEHSLPPTTVAVPVAVTPSLPTSPVFPSTATPSLATHPVINRVANVKGADAGHVEKLPPVKTHRIAPEPSRVAQATDETDAETLTNTTPVVHPMPAIASKNSHPAGPRLAVLKQTTSVHPKIKPNIDESLHEAEKPAAPLSKPNDVVPTPATREAKNTPSTEDAITPTLPPSTVEIGAPVVVHPMRLDSLIARAHLTSFQDEHRGIKVALDAGARAAASASTQFVMLPAVYSPTALSKSPTSESH